MSRWIQTDLRARPYQATAMLLLVAGVATALLLSATLLEGATNPWRALFARTTGADVWLRLTARTPFDSATLPGVTGIAGPYQAVAATLANGPVQAPVQLWAMRPAPPAIGRPWLRQGGWLTPSRPSGVVLEASFAQALHLVPGSAFRIDGLDGSSVPATVVGIADTSNQGFYPDQTPGLMWVLPGLFTRVEPVRRHTGEVVGLRLADPSSANFVVQESVTRLGSGAVTGALTWQQVEQSMNGSDPLLGLLLALFGLVALGGALVAISNAAGGRVLTQLRDLAMLRTLGFTPRQLVGMLVAEHSALALAGAGAGVLAARLLTAAISRELPIGSVAAIAPLPAGWVLLIVGCVVSVVLLATVVSGWRAGRVWPVSDAGPPVPGGRLSGLTRAALLSRLPPAAVLGARAAFTRLPHAVLTIAGLALPVAMITIGIGFWATLDNVEQHPGQIGLAAALTVSPGSIGRPQTERILNADPDVAAIYPSATVSALLPAETSAITTLAIGSSRRPFPFHVAQGRLYRAPGEAVASQGLLDAARYRVGELIRIPVGGVPVIFRIVGRIIEPEYGGQVLAYGIDTLTSDGAVPPPLSYSLVLRPGISAAQASAWLRHASGGRLDVVRSDNPAISLGIVRPMLTGLFVVLALIALTSLLTASAVGLRDHLRDVGALRAMGMTPAQVMSSLVIRTTVLALVGTAVGVVCGTMLTSPLIDVAGRAYGVGAGLGSSPSPGAALAAGGAVLIAAAMAAFIPARRAAATPITATLAY